MIAWTRCVGISSRLPGSDHHQVAFHDLDRADSMAVAMLRLLGTYSSVLAVGTRRGAHLVSFDLVSDLTAQATKADLEEVGQDPKHTQAQIDYGRSVLRVSQKYADGSDLHAVLFQRERRHARPWSGPHWDFYRSLLGLPERPAPGPDNLRVDGDGAVILEVYYTPKVAP